MTGTVTLDSPAPPEGAEVVLTGSDPTLAGTQARLFLLAAETSGTFTVSTAAVPVRTTVTLSATYAGTTRSAALTLDPPAEPSPGEARSVTLSPHTLTGGGGSTGHGSADGDRAG